MTIALFSNARNIRFPAKCKPFLVMCVGFASGPELLRVFLRSGGQLAYETGVPSVYLFNFRFAAYGQQWEMSISSAFKRVFFLSSPLCL
jgi:hypothetical protein